MCHISQHVIERLNFNYVQYYQQHQHLTITMFLLITTIIFLLIIINSVILIIIDGVLSCGRKA